MTHDLGMGRCLKVALFALAAVGCSTRSLADLRAAHDDGSARDAAEASPGPPLPEHDGAVTAPSPDPVDGPVISAEAAPPVDASPEVAGPPPRLLLESIPGTRQYGGTGGDDTSVTCGPDQVLIGYAGNARTTSTPVVSRLEGRCGRLAITASPPYRVTVTASGSLPSVGQGSGNAFTALCPADQVLVGFFGRDGLIMDQVGFHCAPLIIEIGPPATLMHGPITTLGPWPATRGGDDFGENCRPTGVANGHSVNASSWIDGIGLRCTGARLAP